MISWVNILAGFRAYTLVDLDTNEVEAIFEYQRTQ